MSGSAKIITIPGTVEAGGHLHLDETLPIEPGPVEVTVRPIESARTSRKKMNILDLAGVGAEMWQKIDVDKEIRKLRDEWDRKID